jgi:hypothetical protein
MIAMNFKLYKLPRVINIYFCCSDWNRFQLRVGDASPKPDESGRQISTLKDCSHFPNASLWFVMYVAGIDVHLYGVARLIVLQIHSTVRNYSSQ